MHENLLEIYIVTKLIFIKVQQGILQHLPPPLAVSASLGKHNFKTSFQTIRSYRSEKRVVALKIQPALMGGSKFMGMVSLEIHKIA